MSFSNNTGRAFNCPERPLGTTGDPFAQTQIQTQVKRRMDFLDFPDQDKSSLCGPAVFFTAYKSITDMSMNVWCGTYGKMAKARLAV